MVKQHMIRIAAPKTWPILKKKTKFITRPLPGGHPLEKSTSITTVIKEMLKLAKTSKEVKGILNAKEIIINGKRVKEPKRAVGFMDIVSMPELKKSWAMRFTEKGKLSMAEIPEGESKEKFCQIMGKSKVKAGKIQLNLHDGRNMIIDKDKYKTGDTIKIDISDRKIVSHLKFEKGSTIMLIGGKQIGRVCEIEDIQGDKITLKKDGKKFETLRKYAFVIEK